MYNARFVRRGVLKRELANRLMNFNEVVSSCDRCKGCPESGFILAVKQPLTKLLVASFHRRDYNLTSRKMICEKRYVPILEQHSKTGTSDVTLDEQ